MFLDKLSSRENLLLDEQGEKSYMWNAKLSVSVDENFEHEFEESFALHRDAAKKRKKRQRAKRKEISLKTLGARRRQNISIPLQVLGMSPDDIVEALVVVDDEKLTAEALEKVLNFLPKADEIKGIDHVVCDLERKLRKKSPGVSRADIIKMLPPEERLLARLDGIGDVNKKVQLLLFRLTYKEEFKSITQRLKKLSDSVKEIQTSIHLRRILFNILYFVNILNETNAKGFKIATLQKLSGTKMTNGQKGSLLDVVVKHALQSSKGEAAFVDDIADIDRGVHVDYEELKREVNVMGSRLRAAKALSASLLAADSKNRLGAVLRGFYDAQNDSQCKLEFLLRECWNRFENLRTFFLETDMTMNDFLRAFCEFRRSFIESRKRLEQQRRKLESKERKDRSRSKSPRRRVATRSGSKKRSPRSWTRLDKRRGRSHRRAKSVGISNGRNPGRAQDLLHKDGNTEVGRLRSRTPNPQGNRILANYSAASSQESKFHRATPDRHRTGSDNLRGSVALDRLDVTATQFDRDGRDASGMVSSGANPLSTAEDIFREL